MNLDSLDLAVARTVGINLSDLIEVSILKEPDPTKEEVDDTKPKRNTFNQGIFIVRKKTSSTVRTQNGVLTNKVLEFLDGDGSIFPTTPHGITLQAIALKLYDLPTALIEVLIHPTISISVTIKRSYQGLK
jgi:hypothetical protein